MAGLLGDIHGTYQRANPMEGLLRGLQVGGQFGLALRQQRMAEEQAKAEQEQRARAEKVQKLAMTIEANNKMKNNPAMQKALGQAATQMMVELGMLPEGTNYVHNEEAKDYFKALGDLKRAYLDQGDIESWQRGVMETTSHFAEQGKDVQSQAGALEKQAAEATLAQLGEMTRAGSTNMPELKSSPMALEEQTRLMNLAEKQDFNTAQEFQKRKESLNKPLTKTIPGVSDITTIRKEFESHPVVKDYNEVLKQSARINAAYDYALKGTNNTFVDQAVITVYNKMLDPSSVVRESEYARTPDDLALLNKLKGKYEKAWKGGAGLTNEDRKAAMEMAQRFIDSQEKQYNELEKNYRNIARDMGINPNHVITTPRMGRDKIKPATAKSKFKIISVE